MISSTAGSVKDGVEVLTTRAAAKPAQRTRPLRRQLACGCTIAAAGVQRAAQRADLALIRGQAPCRGLRIRASRSRTL